MSERTEPDAAAPDALSGAVEVFAAQAFVLDRMFYRAAKEAVSGNLRLALRAAARDAERFSNLNEQTDKNGKFTL